MGVQKQPHPRPADWGSFLKTTKAGTRGEHQKTARFRRNEPGSPLATFTCLGEGARRMNPSNSRFKRTIEPCRFELGKNNPLKDQTPNREKGEISHASPGSQKPAARDRRIAFVQKKGVKSVEFALVSTAELGVLNRLRRKKRRVTVPAPLLCSQQ